MVYTFLGGDLRSKSDYHALESKNNNGTKSGNTGVVHPLTLGSKEFFINRAIGWILREYSGTNPESIISFC